MHTTHFLTRDLFLPTHTHDALSSLSRAPNELSHLHIHTLNYFARKMIDARGSVNIDDACVWGVHSYLACIVFRWNLCMCGLFIRVCEGGCRLFFKLKVWFIQEDLIFVFNKNVQKRNSNS